METIVPRITISCLDLKLQHRQIKEEIFLAFEEVYDNTAFSGGPYVEAFEKEFAGFCGTKYAVGVNNGTSALQLAILALGIGPGDEVIIPVNTFIATAWGVSYSGATPVFADCNPNTWQIDIDDIEHRISKKTKAIIGVHLYGQPFDVAGVKAICNKHKLHFIEDAAQAQGAKFFDSPVGSFGDLACFSFYPGKNLGACGEAGGITTDREDYFKHIQKLRNHGSEVRYYHDEIGFNMRMGGLEAASLKVKLQHLHIWNAKRQEIASIYQQKITNPKILMQVQPSWAQSVYHLFVVTTERRDELMKYLSENNIAAGLHYPVPCHLQKAYKHLDYAPGHFPNAEYLADHCLSLPMYPELSYEDISYIVDVLNNY
jgi:dTDP-4-amino-4,6-dideoxygalactose transaminase